MYCDDSSSDDIRFGLSVSQLDTALGATAIFMSGKVYAIKSDEKKNQRFATW